MKFDCKELDINDEELGCTITLQENKTDYAGESKMSIDEQMAANGQYLILQRTYPEDEFESDFYYIETSSGKGGELKDFSITLTPTQFSVTYDNEHFEISIHPTGPQYENLKKTLAKLVNESGQLTIRD